MANKDKKNRELPPFADIDKLIHEPARLLLMSLLYVIESADFLFLMRQVGLTHGNLSSHLSKLEEAGYIDIQKEFIHKKPHTMIALSESGRRSFQEYRKIMKQMFEDFPE